MGVVPWRVAWQEALYAAHRGFYVTRGGPSAHFTTATHGVTGRVLAESLLRLWWRTHDQPPAAVVDVGAGRGELVSHLLHHHLADPRSRYSADTGDLRIPRTTRWVGIDVVERPEGLDERIEWVRSPGGADLPGLPRSRYSADAGDRRSPRTGGSGRSGSGRSGSGRGLENALVVAHEWLDVVPCTIAEAGPDGTLVELLVDSATGSEQPGDPIDPADLAWADEHWPDRATGDRVEIGRARDDAWSGLLDQMHSGLVVAIDYGHVRTARPSGGTLAAYRHGRETHPVPDGTCDVTAHVAMDSLAADELHRQSVLLRELGIRGTRPPHELTTRDPAGYLAGLERAGAEAALLAAGGFGDFWWAVKHVTAAT